MSDLTVRLRTACGYDCAKARMEAIDEIRRLEAEVDKWKVLAVMAPLTRSGKFTDSEFETLRKCCIAAIKKLRPCSTCKGRGYEESPPFREWADENTPVLSTVKIRCRRCKGTKVEPA